MQLSSIRAQIMFCSTFVEIKLENIRFDLLSLIYEYLLSNIRKAKINNERFIYLMIFKLVFDGNKRAFFIDKGPNILPLSPNHT